MGRTPTQDPLDPCGNKSPRTVEIRGGRVQRRCSFFFGEILGVLADLRVWPSPVDSVRITQARNRRTLCRWLHRLSAGLLGYRLNNWATQDHDGAFPGVLDRFPEQRGPTFRDPTEHRNRILELNPGLERRSWARLFPRPVDPLGALGNRVRKGPNPLGRDQR